MGSRLSFFRGFVLSVQRLLGNQRLLRGIEKSLIQSINSELMPPIFIVGAPRTGSTLLFQLLIQRFHFAYLNNLESFFYGSPAVFAKLTHRFVSGRPAKFRSRTSYGYISGVLSPSEAGAIFRRWFGESDLAPYLVESDKELIRKTVNYISSLTSAPFLSKNLYNSLRIITISSVFPEAFYIWIRRDPLYTCQSLIRMRRELYGTDRQWASVKPDNYRILLNCDPFEQVVRQVKVIDDHIEDAANTKKLKNLVRINYKDLCEEPQRELGLTAKTYKDTYGIELKERSFSDFTIRSGDKKNLNDHEWQHLVNIVAKVYGKPSRFYA
jgi:hypothetical protein